jgi:hypothetical protein
LVEETSVKAAGRLAASREVAAIQGLFDLPLTSRQVIQGGIQIVRGLLSLLSGKAPKM